VDIGASEGGSEGAGAPPKLLSKEALAKVRAQKILFPSKG
jgi:hypothetical protein